MGPTLSEVHYNRPLASYALNYGLQQDYLADKVAPVIQSQFKSDKYYIFVKEYWMQANAAPRAPGAPSQGGQWHIAQGDFNCQVTAFHYDLPDQVRSNFDTALNADQSSARFVQTNMLNRNEYDWHSKMMVRGVWTGAGGDVDVGNNGGGYWNSDTSNPPKLIRSLMTKVQGTTTKRPNTLILTQDIADSLLDNKYLLDLVRFTGEGGFVTIETLKRVFDVPNIYIARTVLNTAQTGLAPNTGFLSSNCFLLCYVTPTANSVEPTAMAKFVWTGYLNGAGVNGLVMKQFRMEEFASDRFEAEMCYDHRIIAPDLGVFGYNVLQ